MPKLTKLSVEKIRPDPDNEVTVWDTELRGFGIRIWPSGQRSYILKYRTEDGRQRKATIGRHGVITCEQARRKALHWLSEATQGGDPAGDKSARLKAPTIKELADRYMEEHAKVKKRASSLRTDEILIRVQPPFYGPFLIRVSGTGGRMFNA